MARFKKLSKRRGVILLVCLALLALFTMVVLTYVLVARQHKAAALAANRGKHYDDSFDELLEQAALQVVRGTDNPLSVIGKHGLLEDIYGNDAQEGVIGAFVVVTSPPGAFMVGGGGIGFFDVPLTGVDGAPGLLNFDDDADTVNDNPPVAPNSSSELGLGDDFKLINDYYNGRVLTMINGSLQGVSTRIVGYYVNSAGNSARIYFLPFEGMRSNGTSWDTTFSLPKIGDKFHINGGPFNGSGAGNNGLTGLVDARELAGMAPLLELANSNLPTPVVDQRQWALLPFGRNPQEGVNHTNYQNYLKGQDGVLGTADDGIIADEDYDAADYQNMLLAARFGFQGAYSTMPSLYRPDLIQYWINRYKTAGADLTNVAVVHEMLSHVCARPLPLNAAMGHPNFTGSNPGTTFSNITPTNLSPLVDNWPPGATPGNGIPDCLDALYADVNNDTTPDMVYDVDNDGDGRPDSIWVDIGLPVQTAADGRTFKPLVAVFVEDMDGRINLNAAGSTAHYQKIPPPAPGAPNEEYGNPYDFNSGTQAFYAFGGAAGSRPTGKVGTRGRAWSPAFINLSQLLPAPYTSGTPVNHTVNEYRQLLQGRPADLDFDGTPEPGVVSINGRYGEIHLFGLGSGLTPKPGVTKQGVALGTGYAGIVEFPGDDNMPANSVFRVAGALPRYSSGNFYEYVTSSGKFLGQYGTPADLNENGGLMLDPFGRPLRMGMGEGTAGPDTTLNTLDDVDEAIDEPTEIDLSSHAMRSYPNGGATRFNIDEPFTPSEFEYLLRYNDHDRMALPDRIAALAPTLATTEGLRTRVTTESWDLPTPSFHLTPEWRKRLVALATGTAAERQQYLRLQALGIGFANIHATGLLAMRLIETNFGLNTPLTVAQTNAVQAEINNMLSTDLSRGLRMDINRPLGNGRDDDGDGVIDDPDEASAAPAVETLWANSNAALGGAGGILFDHNNDGQHNAYDALARHYMARHLYVLLMLLRDAGYIRQTPDEPTLTDNNIKKELAARQLAQWAINAVDFRDRDLIMTPFEYDVNPWDGWNVDGFIGPNPGPDGIFGNADDPPPPNDTDDAHADRRLVWGCESPVLLLTESVAFHDRRVERVAPVTLPNQPMDQRRIPQGSLFLELYCPGGPTEEMSRDTSMYTPLGGLDLGKMSGDDPVWRVAIGGRNVTTVKNNVWDRFYSAGADLKPQSTFLDPDAAPRTIRVNPIKPTADPAITIDIERIVWLANQKPAAAHADKEYVYYNQFDTSLGVVSGGVKQVPVEAGQYVVIGPTRTHQAEPADTKHITKIGLPGATDEVQKIALQTSATVTFSVTDNNSGADNDYKSYPYPQATPNSSSTAGRIQRPITIAAGGDRDDPAVLPAWPAVLGPIGLSVSEPLFSATNYYPAPDDPTTTDDADGTKTLDKYLSAVTPPLDTSNGRPLAGDPSDRQTRTHSNFKTAFLQRLANPLLPFNATSNPYVTVDWMPIDLTVFNGQSTQPPVDPADLLNGADSEANAPANSVRFLTRQRGSPRGPTGNTSTRNLWSAETQDTDLLPATADNPGSDVPNFKHRLDHTLGFINESFHDATQPDSSMAGYVPRWNEDNSKYGAYTIGAPSKPFPWLTWNDRPYQSAMELLLVPSSGPDRLTFEYSMRTAGPPAFIDHYTTGRTAPNYAPFRNLLNFFAGADSDPNNDPTKDPSDPPPVGHAEANLYRLFEYVTVPSRFSGTDELLNPNAGDNNSVAGGVQFHPPFNRVSRFREPGKVNINTVFDYKYNWLTVVNDTSGALDYDRIVMSRRGYGPPGDAVYPFRYNPDSPTIFANPFRAFDNGLNVPLDSLTRRGATPAGARRTLVESSLLRPNLDPAFTLAPPLLSEGYDIPNGTSAPTNGDPADLETDRNPFFRYEGQQRLGNLVTTRSNVYAIWVTVGFFEVSRVTVDQYHPDGYALGQEIGADSGEIKRHRAFYLFDRSIPVAFERGKNHNVHKAMLIQRVIE